jgi:uncharacterized protein
MSDEVLEKMGERVAEHATVHEQDSTQIIFHGGEPMLNGRQYIDRAATRLRALMPAGVELRLGMQTNGVLLDERWLDTLLERQVKLGISIDGPQGLNDRRRPFKNGRGSFARVDKALRLLGTDRYRQLFSGILCTIEPDSDPVHVLDTIASYSPPSLDLLIPHATWEHPPARSESNSTPLGKWLIRAFDHWAGGALGETPTRMFEGTITGLIHGRGLSEQLGLSPVAMAVVESDGTYEQTDSLKVAAADAPATGLDVFRHSLDDVLARPEVRARQLGLASLSTTCQKCPLVSACGGGHYVHRFSTEKGHDNPTVYCEDMKVYIPHVRDVVQAILDRARKASQTPPALPVA